MASPAKVSFVVANHDEIQPAQRLLVVMSAKSWRQDSVLYTYLQYALAQRLSYCGVVAKLWYLEQLKDPEGYFRRDMATFEPDAVAFLREVGRSPESFFFEGKVYSRRSGYVVWMAKAQLGTPPLLSLEMAERSADHLARAIISRLRDDRVLPSCPAKWPTFQLSDCIRKWGRLLDGLRLVDGDRGRLEMYKYIPSCEAN